MQRTQFESFFVSLFVMLVGVSQRQNAYVFPLNGTVWLTFYLLARDRTNRSKHKSEDLSIRKKKWKHVKGKETVIFEFARKVRKNSKIG